MLYLSAALIAYLVGSFPTAYVMGRYFHGVDITKGGTGNIGAMNAYEVTRSKWIGIAVGTVDILKGLIVTFSFLYISGLIASSVAALFVVTGHNYSVYMRFKGGRGLAPSAGALLVLSPLAVLVYLVIYAALRGVGLKLYLSSVVGIFASALAVLWNFSSAHEVELVLAGLFVVVLSKHIGPLKNELIHAS